MAEVAPAPAKTAAKKKAAPKPRKAGPGAAELILQAVAASKERNGVSLAALKKYVAGKGYDVEKNNARFKTVIKSLVAKGTLVQTKGTGASGSFKMNKKSEGKATAPAKAAKKTPAKAKKPAPKKNTPSKKSKPAAAKKTAAKKPAKKPAKSTPKKAKKPVKSPKKVVPKKPTAAKKAAVAKKSPAKAAKPKAAKKAPKKK